MSVNSWEFQPDNEFSDITDDLNHQDVVSEKTSDRIVNVHDKHLSPQSTTLQSNDVCLNAFNQQKHDVRLSEVGGKSQSVQPSATKSNAYFHPNSQINLYNKSLNCAAVIRLGNIANNLISIVVDICPEHNGRSSDWNNKISVAFSHTELIQAYSLFLQNLKCLDFKLKFHQQQTGPLSIGFKESSIYVSTIISGKTISLTGNIAQKIKFMAQLEVATKHYFATAFPDLDQERILRQIALI
ncbi:hypothetical protein ACXITX_20700 [Vibrio parahaemolyticus]|uniref:hypothetical protein n=1 Tax=Vibrio TaxID=662 RepID=UPI0009860733|nr:MULTISPECIES: hypothetical protein [Vibrio]OOH98779.1 hypothetical protein BIW16_18380 [Vibrio sp. OULL4]MBO0154487.1 hypothetical protein [Vibrio parahaemolyticus]MBO0159143.1 hypothetical protein [Vibrio parahaemolyticus]MBO0164724.1 hypothetical protein [Vibrio alginolyticus]MBO0169624.1 hypothetical protein [Vibrio parahaemolyticus]